MNSASQVVSPADIDKVEASIELDNHTERPDNQGRLSGRNNSIKEYMICQSMKDTTINKFDPIEAEADADANKKAVTPQVVIQDSKQLDISSNTAPALNQDL